MVQNLFGSRKWSTFKLGWKPHLAKKNNSFKKKLITLLRVIPTMTFQNSLLTPLLSEACLTFFLTFFCTFFVPYHEVRQGTLGVDTRGWGPAGNTGRGWSWLRSGREHWAGMVVVEVRQGTLGVDGRGWGPTENTVRRGSRLSRRRRRGEEERSRQLT